MSDPKPSSIPPTTGGPRLPQKSPNSRRNAFVVIAILVLVGLAAWWFFGRNGGNGDAQGQGQQRSAGGRSGQRGAGAMGGGRSGRGRPSATVGTAKVEKTDVPLTISAIGTVQPTVTATVRSQISGVLKAIYFKEGQLVSKGQALAQVDSGPTSQAVAQAQGTDCYHAQAAEEKRSPDSAGPGRFFCWARMVAGASCPTRTPSSRKGCWTASTASGMTLVAISSMLTGAIVGAMGIGLSTPGAGIFSLFLLQDAGHGAFVAAAGWFGAALVGTMVSTAVLLVWRRQAVRQGKYTTDSVMP